MNFLNTFIDTTLKNKRIFFNVTKTQILTKIEMTLHDPPVILHQPQSNLQFLRRSFQITDQMLMRLLSSEL